MKRMDELGEDISLAVSAWQDNDTVEMTGFEYDKMVARLDVAIMSVNNLKLMMQAIQKQINDEKGAKIGDIVKPEFTGGLRLKQ